MSEKQLSKGGDAKSREAILFPSEKVVDLFQEVYEYLDLLERSIGNVRKYTRKINAQIVTDFQEINYE